MDTKSIARSDAAAVTKYDREEPLAEAEAVMAVAVEIADGHGIVDGAFPGEVQVVAIDAELMAQAELQMADAMQRRPGD